MTVSVQRSRCAVDYSPAMRSATCCGWSTWAKCPGAAEQVQLAVVEARL